MSRLPEHLAIIMDGNGRWAKLRGLGRIRGHREGAKRVDEIVTECARLGVKYLTLYTFSTENWNRPTTEVNMLMRLLVENLKVMDKKLLKNQISFSVQGHLDRVPNYVMTELKRVEKLTALSEPKMRLSLALSYGGRQELVDCMKTLAEEVSSGKLLPADIDESTIRARLYHPSFPDPDLLIRTGGESRISNFLLWQVAYSEILILNEHWPEFGPASLRESLEVYGKKQRRFGKTSEQVASLAANPATKSVSL